LSGNNGRTLAPNRSVPLIAYQKTKYQETTDASGIRDNLHSFEIKFYKSSGRIGFDALFFVRNTKGIAMGPKTAPIMAQNLVFAPLLSAICQRRKAHIMLSVEMIIIPVIIKFLLRFGNNPRINDIIESDGTQYWEYL
jgi:hypothetical protein